MNLGAHQADVAQQAVVEPRQLPLAGARARAAPHRIDHTVTDEAGEAGQESAQPRPAAHTMLIAHDLHLQKAWSRETCSRLLRAFGMVQR
jgi:hypothetical protein